MVLSLLWCRTQRLARVHLVGIVTCKSNVRLKVPPNFPPWGFGFTVQVVEPDPLPTIPVHYLPNEQKKYDEGMKVPADFLQRKGYRLPTKVEWEYARPPCTAMTSRHYGLSVDLLEQYDRYRSMHQATTVCLAWWKQPTVCNRRFRASGGRQPPRSPHSA